jgi:hypothetical protein
MQGTRLIKKRRRRKQKTNEQMKEIKDIELKIKEKDQGVDK